MCQVKLEVKYTAKGFDKLDLKGKAEYVMSLKNAQNELKNALASVQTIFEEDLNDERKKDVTQTLQITTVLGVVELPSGYAEKTLKADEVEAFVKALKALDINAYKQAISTVPKVDKVEVNKLRKEVGAIKTLIDKTYASKENKPAVYTLSKTI